MVQPDSLLRSMLFQIIAASFGMFESYLNCRGSLTPHRLNVSTRQ